MGRNDFAMQRNTELRQNVTGELHCRPVGLAAHHDRDGGSFVCWIHIEDFAAG